MATKKQEPATPEDPKAQGGDEAQMKDPPAVKDAAVAQPADSSAQLVTVRVDVEKWPYKMITSAGMIFTVDPITLRADHPAMDELRANDYLIVKEL